MQVAVAAVFSAERLGLVDRVAAAMLARTAALQASPEPPTRAVEVALVLTKTGQHPLQTMGPLAALVSSSSPIPAHNNSLVVSSHLLAATPFTLSTLLALLARLLLCRLRT
jgi:hypothetical protein